MEHKILALCDPEEDYAGQLSAYLQSYREFPWEVEVYTGISQLAEGEKQKEVDLLLVAESVYAPELPVEAGATVLLNESGLVRWSSLKNVDKYQPAENVLKELLEIYMEKEDNFYPRLCTGQKTRIVGMYSPVR